LKRGGERWGKWGERVKGLKERVEGVIGGYPELRVVILFGSAASERLTPNSDIDIAVAAGRPLGVERMAKLHFDLARVLPLEVDLVDLQRASGILLQEILGHGTLIRSTPSTYTDLMARMWYNQADMMPYTRRILEKHARRFVHG
jgi:predicted nucleotidyltransferase